MFEEDKSPQPFSAFLVVVSALLFFVLGVQLGIDHGRELAKREARMQKSEVGAGLAPALNLESETPAPEPQALTPVTIYAYAPVRRCTDSTPLITASNQHVRPGIIAVSRDIEADMGLRFGDRVHIYGLGTYEFQDRMNARYERSVDIYMPTERECRVFGVKVGTIAKLAGEQAGMLASK